MDEDEDNRFEADFFMECGAGLPAACAMRSWEA